MAKQRQGPQGQQNLRLFGSKEAMAYLGLDWASFRKHVYTWGHLKPDMRVGRNMVFTQQTLDRWRDKHRTEGLTIRQAAKYLGVSFSWMRNQVYNTKLIVPDGKRGNAHIFKIQTLDAVKSLIRSQTPSE